MEDVIKVLNGHGSANAVYYLGMTALCVFLAIGFGLAFINALWVKEVEKGKQAKKDKDEEAK